MFFVAWAFLCSLSFFGTCETYFLATQSKVTQFLQFFPVLLKYFLVTVLLSLMQAARSIALQASHEETCLAAKLAFYWCYCHRSSAFKWHHYNFCSWILPHPNKIQHSLVIIITVTSSYVTHFTIVFETLSYILGESVTG